MTDLSALKELAKKATPAWHDAGYGVSKAVDVTGRIVGRIERDIVTGEVRAEADGQHLGKYITTEYAKEAVTRALRSALADLEGAGK